MEDLLVGCCNHTPSTPPVTAAPRLCWRKRSRILNRALVTTPWRSHTPPPITPGGGGGRSKRGDETVTAELLLSDIGKNEWQIVFTRHIQTWQNNT